MSNQSPSGNSMMTNARIEMSHMLRTARSNRRTMYLIIVPGFQPILATSKHGCPEVRKGLDDDEAAAPPCQSTYLILGSAQASTRSDTSVPMIVSMPRANTMNPARNVS